MIITIEDYFTMLRVPNKTLRFRIFAFPENHNRPEVIPQVHGYHDVGPDSNSNSKTEI